MNNTCKCGKVSYNSKQDAERVCNRHAKYKRSKLNVYKCYLEEVWHLGRNTLNNPKR